MSALLQITIYPFFAWHVPRVSSCLTSVLCPWPAADLDRYIQSTSAEAYLIRSHLWMSSRAGGRAHEVASVDWKQANWGHNRSASLRGLILFLPCFYRLSTRAQESRTDAPGRPCDLCQSGTAGIWHHSASTRLSLRLWQRRLSGPSDLCLLGCASGKPVSAGN